VSIRLRDLEALAGGSYPPAIFVPLSLTSINPTSVSAGGGAFLLTATGEFVNGDTIYLDGSSRVTSFVNATTVTANISGALAQGPHLVTVHRGSRTTVPKTLTVTALAAFDPSAYTIAEVLDYACEHPDEIPAILAAERAGKNRSTLIAQLEDLLEGGTNDGT
jgi:hypothetical protein